MHPILIDKPFGIEFITIHTFGLMVVISFLMGSWLVGRLSVKAGLDKEQMANLTLWLLLVGIVGARIMYVFVNFDQFRNQSWTRVFQIWEGGIVWYGGMIASTLFAMVYLNKLKIPRWKALDALVAGTFFALGIARWGCFFAGCCYGRACASPWAVTFSDPNSVVGREYQMLGEPLPTQPLHPTQIYSSIAAFLVAAVLVKLHGRRKFDGQVFAVGLMLYPIGRFIIEIYRNDRTRGFIWGLSTSQAIGIGVFLLGLVVYRLRSRSAEGEAAPVPS